MLKKSYFAPSVVSLFSGAGGMDLGFLQAGFNIIFANDFMKEAVDTYNLNFEHKAVCEDIRNISSSNIPNDPDVVIGGFPCQGFSIANKNRSMNDERNFLYKELLRVVKDKKPKYFVAENVKGLLSIENGKVIKMIISDFENLGYKVDYQLVNAAEYGVPELRERVIIIGNRIGKKNSFPAKTHYIDKKVNGLKPAITCQEAIGWLVDAPIRDLPFEYNNKTIKNNVASDNVREKFFGRKYNVNQHDICDYLKYYRNKSNLSTKQIDMHFGYKHTAGHWFRKDNKSGSIPKPNDWWELKKILKFDDKYDSQVTTFIEKPILFEQSLRITNWDRPSDTITATTPEIHINKQRRLSVRECAIIQTFPLEFEFTGSLNKMYTQIGNAVPVLLASKIAIEIKKKLI